MGQQQLLLIVLGVIVVGIAIIVGLSMFDVNSTQQKREQLIAECVNLASMAQKYYLTPATFGGGNSNFTGWEIPKELDSTYTGKYTFDASPSKSSVVINAKSSAEVTGEQEIEVEISVYPKDYKIKVLK